MSGAPRGRARDPRRELGAAARTARFVAELLPMLPSGALERLPPRPVHERIVVRAPSGTVAADLFRPDRGGAHPGIALFLGVVPAGLAHDRVVPVEESRRLAEAMRGRDGVRYTDFALFEHGDPGSRRLAPHRRELGWFARCVHPVFRV